MSTLPGTVQTADLIERFWEIFPSVWHTTRAHIRYTAAERFNLTVEQFQVLRRIRRGIDSVSAIANDNRTSRPAVSKAVDTLVQKGLVTRKTDAVDRRHVHLALTREGQRAIQDIYDETEAWLAGKFQKLSPEEMKLLLDAMQLFNQTFSEPYKP